AELAPRPRRAGPPHLEPLAARGAAGAVEPELRRLLPPDLALPPGLTLLLAEPPGAAARGPGLRRHLAPRPAPGVRGLRCPPRCLGVQRRRRPHLAAQRPDPLRRVRLAPLGLPPGLRPRGRPSRRRRRGAPAPAGAAHGLLPGARPRPPVP